MFFVYRMKIQAGHVSTLSQVLLNRKLNHDGPCFEELFSTTSRLFSRRTRLIYDPRVAAAFENNQAIQLIRLMTSIHYSSAGEYTGEPRLRFVERLFRNGRDR